MGTAVFILFVSALALCATALRSGRARLLFDEWAEREGLTVLSASCCWMWSGPFWWCSGNGTVYRVVVRDPRGGTRRGYARCGSYWLGMLASDVDVEWDD